MLNFDNFKEAEEFFRIQIFTLVDCFFIKVRSFRLFFLLILLNLVLLSVKFAAFFLLLVWKYLLLLATLLFLC